MRSNRTEKERKINEEGMGERRERREKERGEGGDLLLSIKTQGRAALRTTSSSKSGRTTIKGANNYANRRNIDSLFTLFSFTSSKLL